jgi:hypothetical protein
MIFFPQWSQSMALPISNQNPHQFFSNSHPILSFAKKKMMV